MLTLLSPLTVEECLRRLRAVTEPVQFLSGWGRKRTVFMDQRGGRFLFTIHDSNVRGPFAVLDVRAAEQSNGTNITISSRMTRFMQGFVTVWATCGTVVPVVLVINALLGHAGMTASTLGPRLGTLIMPLAAYHLLRYSRMMRNREVEELLNLVKKCTDAAGAP